MWFLGLWNYFAGRMWKSLQFGGCKSPQSAARRADESVEDENAKGNMNKPNSRGFIGEQGP